MVNLYRQSTIFIFSLLFLAACSTNNENIDKDLAVQIVNSGSEELKIQIGSASSISFCYKEQGCAASVFSQIRTVNPGRQVLVAASNPNFKVIGVKVEFEVISGTGRVHILQGEAYKGRGTSFSYDSETAIVYSTDPFSAESFVRFEYGEVN